MKNSYEILGDFTAIKLLEATDHPLETLIDTEDLAKAMKFPDLWSANFMKNTSSFYAVADVRKAGMRSKLLLHRVILDAPSDLVVDHINHDTLDNRKSNIRLVTSAENFQNQNGPYKNNKSGIRGVCWHKATGKWYASIKLNGVCKYLGVYDDIKEAERVAKEARKELMPFYVEEAITGGS